MSSSNKDGSTTAEAPRSSIRRRMSRLRPSGDAEGTTGLLSRSPKYVVERSGMSIVITVHAVRDRLRRRAGATSSRSPSLAYSKLEHEAAAKQRTRKTEEPHLS